MAAPSAPAMPVDPGATAARPAPSAAPGPSPDVDRLHAALLERLRRKRPEWAGRPEDPASVLLEVWAEALGDLSAELDRSDERVLRRLVDLLELEPRGPRPSRGAVQFVPAGPLGRPIVVPAGTRVVTAPASGRPRAVFETVEDAWVSDRPIAFAFGLHGGSLKLLPVRGAGGAGVPPLPLFGEDCEAGRSLALGDRRLAGLGERADPWVLEWDDVSIALTGGEWRYSSRDGWRGLHVVPEVVAHHGERDRVRLRVVIPGPLPDLREATVEGGTFPWVRVSLPSRGDLPLAAPGLRAPGDAAPRPVMRALVVGGETVEDLSANPSASAPAVVSGRAERQDASILLGLEAPAPFSLFVELDDREPPGAGGELARRNPRPPRVVYECSGGEGWIGLAAGASVRDRTGGFQRSGSLHVTPPPGAAARELFGERLFWVRARWEDGAFLEPPVLRGLWMHAVEVVQGVSRRDVPVASGRVDLRGWIEVPAFPEGVADVFDRLTVETAAATETHERVATLEGAGADHRSFLVRRAADGRLRFSFDGGDPAVAVPPPEARVAIERVRAGIGVSGNLPAGALTRVESPVEGIDMVRQIGSTRGGEDLEPPDVLGGRALERLREGERAVSPSDYRRLARAVLPDAVRVDAWSDPLRSGGVLVAVLPPAERRRAGPALWASLRRYLEDSSPPGTSVRVVAGSSMPAVLEVELEAEDPGSLESGGEERRLDELARWVGSVVRTALEPDAGGCRGAGRGEGPPASGRVAVFPSESLAEHPLEPLISSALEGRPDLLGGAAGAVRLVRADLVVPEGDEGDAADLRGRLAAGGNGYYVEVVRVDPVIGRGTGRFG